MFEFHLYKIHTGHKSLEKLCKINEHKPRGYQWFEFSTSYKYSLHCRSDAANGNAHLLSRFLFPATEGERSGLHSITDPEDIVTCPLADIWGTYPDPPDHAETESALLARYQLDVERNHTAPDLVTVPNDKGVYFITPSAPPLFYPLRLVSVSRASFPDMSVNWGGLTFTRDGCGFWQSRVLDNFDDLGASDKVPSVRVDHPLFPISGRDSSAARVDARPPSELISSRNQSQRVTTSGAVPPTIGYFRRQRTLQLISSQRRRCPRTLTPVVDWPR